MPSQVSLRYVISDWPENCKQCKPTRKLISGSIPAEHENSTISFRSKFYKKDVLFSQMNCTRVSTEDRLSAHCFGNLANRPVEVQAVRSDRPHRGLCYGLSLIHVSLWLQAKGCYHSGGQKELRANLSHSSLRFLTYLGLPSKSAVRLLLRPGPQRWVLGWWLGLGEQI